MDTSRLLQAKQREEENQHYKVEEQRKKIAQIEKDIEVKKRNLQSETEYLIQLERTLKRMEGEKQSLERANSNHV